MRSGVVVLVLALLASSCAVSESEQSVELRSREYRGSSSVESAGATAPGSLGGADIPQLDSALFDSSSQTVVRPVGLSIPDLNIDGAIINPVGVENNGDMEVPTADKVGWYSFGASPIEPGSTVLAAHIAESGVDGVFRYLDRVQIGAEVQVQLEDGSTRSYEVTALEQYNKTELPFEDVFRRSGEQQLVLITCGGDFNRSVSSYEDNVVAYAKPIL